MRFHSRRTLIFAILAGWLGLVFFAVAPAWAATIIVPDCARIANTNAPGLDCVMQTFRNIATLIVGITGSAALLMFVWGGFEMISSAGEPEKVKKGKTILTNAVIGLVIIFTAGYVIDYVTVQLTAGTTLQTAGAQCNNGLGTYQPISGVMTCITPCTAMSPGGYQCMDPSVGTDCDTDYSGCGGSTQCCVPLTPAELQLQAPPTTAPSTSQ
jgi:hypothetical protein